jgi:diguanylate cyclase (GGDEF)-like protein
MTFRARLTLFLLGVVAAPVLVGALVADHLSRSQAQRDADARLQVASVAATAAFQREQVSVTRALSSAVAERAFRAKGSAEVDRLRTSSRLDYLFVIRGGRVAAASIDLAQPFPRHPAAIQGGDLRFVAAERRVIIPPAPESSVLGGRLWEPRLPSALHVHPVLVVQGHPAGALPGGTSLSRRPVSAGDMRLVCLCRGSKQSGVALFTPARAEGLGAWFRWPWVAFAILAIGTLVALAYTLAWLLSRTVSEELSESRQELELTRGKLATAQLMTLTDPLTEVWNRRYLEGALREHTKRHVRFESQFALLLIDIDGFKRVNDAHGHVVGDAILRGVARAILGSIRSDIDVLARFGGDEFAAVLPESDGHGAPAAAEKIRQLVAASSFESDGVEVKITVSIGVAVCPQNGLEPEGILAAADAALYRAKAAGRNRTSLASS